MLRGEEVAWEHEMHKQYGEVVRLGPDRLTYISAQAWKDIAGAGAGKRLENSKDPTTFGPNLVGDRSLGSTPDTATHRARRRVYAPAFSDKALKQQESLIQGYVNSLLRIVKDHADDGQRAGTDIAKLLNCTTFDVMADLTFGEPLGLLEQSELTPWVKAVLDNLRAMSIARVAREYKILSWLVKILTPKAVKKGAQAHYNHTYDRVDKRVTRGIDIGKPDVWKLAMEKSDASDLSKRMMTADAGAFMIAGTEVRGTCRLYSRRY
jgi:cytochrome P450